MDGERTRRATFQSRPAGKQPRKVLADILRAGEAGGGGGEGRGGGGGSGAGGEGENPAAIRLNVRKLCDVSSR